MSEDVKSAVTAMLLYETNSVLVGTAGCDIYLIGLSDFDTRLIVTCHRDTIYDIAFPRYNEETVIIGANAKSNEYRFFIEIFLSMFREC